MAPSDTAVSIRCADDSRQLQLDPVGSAVFFDEAVIEGDGSMVETAGQCKEGIDINHKGQWGYHPLMISLANTNEPLYIVNRRKKLAEDTDLNAAD